MLLDNKLRDFLSSISSPKNNMIYRADINYSQNFNISYPIKYDNII